MKYEELCFFDFVCHPVNKKNVLTSSEVQYLRQMAGTAVQFLDVTQVVIYATLSARPEGWLPNLGWETGVCYGIYASPAFSRERRYV